MPQYRKEILANDETYHIVNRGINRQPIFTCTKEYRYAVAALDYYRFANLPMRLSQVFKLKAEVRSEFLSTVHTKYSTLIDVITYNFMPNHIHFQLKQNMDKGISVFMSNFTNSVTRFCNLRNERNGPIFEGVFKSFHIEDDEQLIHVNRYIHLNPVVAFMVKIDELETYPWSSLPEYLGNNDHICNKEIILNNFRNIQAYKKFLYDQIDYARELDRIKHLTRGY